MSGSGAAAVAAWLDGIDAAVRPAVEALRAIVAAAAPELHETIKWNAPSYAADGSDRVTLNIGPRGSLRLILHRGAVGRDDGFAFADPAQLARWPAPDRGVVAFRDLQDVRARAEGVTDLVGRWVAATA